MSFNPKVSEFLKEHKDVTVIGLFWAGYWRLIVAVWGILFGLMILSSIASGISSLF